MEQTKLWIGGQWVVAEKHVSLRTPHTQEMIAEVGFASPEQASSAIENSHEAFQEFKRVSSYERANILSRVANSLTERREEAARLIAMEAGKPIKLARTEIDRTILTYQFAAEAGKNLGGETIVMDAAPRGENHFGFTRRLPLGVVTAITPFNFPFNLVAHKVGPAIAAGNSIVLKPAEQTPLSALFLAELFKAAGLPNGVLNILPGFGQELSQTLTMHPHVQFITFTGSPRIGKIIRQQSGLRRVTLELGSNSPLIVDNGFKDNELDTIAFEATNGAFSYNGQVCISIQRIFVHEASFDKFVRFLTSHVNGLVVGDPLDEATDVSSVINDAAALRLSSWIEQAVSLGARVHCGGTVDGNVVLPTVLSGVAPETSISCEEAFGPVVVVTPFSDWDAAISMANDSKYGLHAGVFTNNVSRVWRAIDHLESGGVLVNQVPTYRLDHMPYGGVKESGTGREGVKYALEEMTELQFVGFRKQLSM